MEQRRLHLNERNWETSTVHSNGEMVGTKLLRIAGKARKDPKCRFTSLYHLVTKELLRECFISLRKKAATGIDGITKEKYAKDLEENLEKLLEKLHKMSYKPQPVKRVYIPKTGGKKRPLGLPILEDKLVQSCLVRILECVYEQDFIADSYGFRPNRSCHDALRELNHTIDKKRVSYIVDADIKGFFDAVNHEWVMKFLEHRIGDKRVLRMVKRFLKAGIIEEGKYERKDKGTPQGGVISPLLANIYLHYVLDLWFEKRFKKSCSGYTKIIRYADDFIVCFQHKTEAEHFLKELMVRLGRFGLEIEPAKTKLILFGFHAREQMRRKEDRKPETFDFLGFTHYCSTTRCGRTFKLKRKTARNKFRAKLKEFKEWVRANRTMPTQELLKLSCVKVAGHIAYFGVSDNYCDVSRFVWEAMKVLHKWMNRRGKRDCYSWKKFNLILGNINFPKPKIMVNLIQYPVNV